jgi:C1A family cysteine protease
MTIMHFLKRRLGGTIPAILLISLLIIAVPLPVRAQDNSLFVAPLADSFVRAQTDTIQSPTYGYLPAPVDLRHLRATPGFQIQAVLPSAYDLRGQDKLTPIGNQGSAGSCWAFATYGSLESNLKPGETRDFSENNLKNTHGFDYAHAAGGNAFMSTAYLARWSGPVDESQDPYNPSSGVSPSGLSPAKHVQEVKFLPDRTGSLDNTVIKQTVMAYGAVYTSMYFGDPYYRAATKSYCYSGSTGSNHAVDIVGWDDNFDRTNFTSAPSANGAFIVRNSWGTGWGDNGYFYISYYDAKVGKDLAVFTNAEATSNYGRVYQYDPLGWVDSAGFNDTTAWIANLFTAQSDEQLAAVGFYTTDLNANYQVSVYDTFNGTAFSGYRGGRSGSLADAGYHTIQLDSSISLQSGHKFCLVVQLTNPSYLYPIAYEYPEEGYSSHAGASAGQSYVSPDGSDWADLTSQIGLSQANVCLKAYTQISPPQPGSVQVTANVSAPFTLAGPNGYSTSGTTPWNQSNLTPGSYTVTWGDFAGYVPPAPQTKILASGGTLVFSGNYQLLSVPGSIQVTANVTAPFMLSGPNNFSYSGLTSWNQGNLTPGSYTVTWGAIAGYITPPLQAQSLPSAGSIVFSGTYQPSSGYIQQFLGGWNLVTIPCETNLPLQQLLGPDFQTAYRWDPATNRYTVPATLEPGSAYWIRMTKGVSVEISGNLAPITDVTLDLAQGWNQIGSPFPQTIPWNVLRVRDGTTELSPAQARDSGWIGPSYAWSGSGYLGADYSNGALSMGQGFWFKANNSGLQLVFPGTT